MEKEVTLKYGDIIREIVRVHITTKKRNRNNKDKVEKKQENTDTIEVE